MDSYRRVVVMVLVLLAAVQAGRSSAQRAAAQPRAVPGELIVKFKAQAAAGERDRVRRRIAAGLLSELVRSPRARADGPVELLALPRSASLQAAIALLRQDPAVDYAEPNWIYTHAAPDDPSFSRQWALSNTGQSIDGSSGTAGADIDALGAWQTTPSAPAVYIGVIDEGIDINHPDLGPQPNGPIWTNPYDPPDGRDNDGNGYADDVHGWDFAANNASVYDGSPADVSVDSHGTHVAGIIAARTDNRVGIAAVSPGVVVIPAKFLGVTGGTTANAVRAIDYLTDLKTRHNLNIIATNNSWSGGGFSQALLDAIARAARQDILFIAASGNGGVDGIGDDNDAFPIYPTNYDTTASAGYDAVISVSATDQHDQATSWTNHGARAVDLSAPGSLILSTTPQNTYDYMDGTSMAAPHVAGAAALVHAARGLTGEALRDVLLGSVDRLPHLFGRSVTGGRLNLARSVNAVPGTPSGGREDIVLYAAQARTVRGGWSVVADSAAAGGARLQSANAGAPKVVTALASPTHYFELEFDAEANTRYRLWMRGRALNNAWSNDSVHVQFDRSVAADGAPAYRIGSTASTEVNLEDCSGCGLSGWGWQDNGYGAGVLGPLVSFSASGRQRIRVQVREDGLGIDQIVLSPERYLSSAPGPLRNDSTILAGGDSGSSGSTAGVVLYAADAPLVMGRWAITPDPTAAGGRRLQNANAGAAKITTALAQPADYFELTFTAAANTAYRLWIRGKASGNSWANDSVHVQFSDSVTAGGAPVYRIGTSSAAEVNLEDCSGCGLAEWGWQDNGWGAGVLGSPLRFASSGPHTIRIQVREDGFGIDQIVLSAAEYLNTAPGGLRDDTTVLPRSGQ